MGETGLFSPRWNPDVTFMGVPFYLVSVYKDNKPEWPHSFFHLSVKTPLFSSMGTKTCCNSMGVEEKD